MGPHWLTRVHESYRQTDGSRQTDRRQTDGQQHIANSRSHSLKIVSCLPDKKNKISPRSPDLTTAWILPKICQGQPQTMYSECSRFHQNRFTFGGVIPEHVNTIKTGRKVFPVFGWNLALSWITRAYKPGHQNPVEMLISVTNNIHKLLDRHSLDMQQWWPPHQFSKLAFLFGWK